VGLAQTTITPQVVSAHSTDSFFLSRATSIAALLQSAPPVRQTVSNSPRRQALAQPRTPAQAYLAQTTTRVAPCLEATLAQRARRSEAVARLVRRTSRVLCGFVRRFEQINAVVQLASTQRTRHDCARHWHQSIAQLFHHYLLIITLTCSHRWLRYQHWEYSLRLKTFWQLNDWRWSLWWFLDRFCLWWLRCKQQHHDRRTCFWLHQHGWWWPLRWPKQDQRIWLLDRNRRSFRRRKHWWIRLWHDQYQHLDEHFWCFHRWIRRHKHCCQSAQQRHCECPVHSLYRKGWRIRDRDPAVSNHYIPAALPELLARRAASG
jgi:hypothetical protein